MQTSCVTCSVGWLVWVPASSLQEGDSCHITGAGNQWVVGARGAHGWGGLEIWSRDDCKRSPEGRWSCVCCQALNQCDCRGRAKAEDGSCSGAKTFFLILCFLSCLSLFLCNFLLPVALCFIFRPCFLHWEKTETQKQGLSSSHGKISLSGMQRGLFRL